VLPEFGVLLFELLEGVGGAELSGSLRRLVGGPGLEETLLCQLDHVACRCCTSVIMAW